MRGLGLGWAWRRSLALQILGWVLLALLLLLAAFSYVSEWKLQTLWPALWLLPLAMGLLWLAVHLGLRPLRDLSAEVGALDIQHPASLQVTPSHRELDSVVLAINTLAGRYQSALGHERQLASELAHEMRTPLAALTLRARALRDVMDGPRREVALLDLERESLRAGQVMADLLALARASRAELAESMQAVDLAELSRQVVADHAQAAFESGHEMSLSCPGPMVVQGHPVLLELGLRNLVENALSHTPRATQVEVQLDPDQLWVQVCDSGPKSAPQRKGAELRTGALGLGLGHRVVEKIAVVHGAHFAQTPAPPGYGNCYRLTFDPEIARPDGGTA